MAELYYHGTKHGLGAGDHVEGVSVTTNLDAAAWESELDPGDGPGWIYIVEPTGPIDSAEPADQKFPGDAEWFRSPSPLRVVGEATDPEGRPLRLYHGTRADLAVGDLIEAGYTANFGRPDRVANFVYFAGTLDAAIWGAELARGDGPGRIYLVEPTGPIMDDPNLTNARFHGNPTKSYRSRDPLRVIAEVTEWDEHPPEAVAAMKAGLARADQEGVEPDD